jgi:hypothetical protein
MKAIFVQIEEKKSGIKVTAWEQEFLYQESCRHVYLTKSVYRNGKKSTVPAFAKVTGQEVPDILKANVYFWRPGTNAAWRRSNEEKRNAELADFMRENREEAEKKLNKRFSDYLLPGEKIKVDSLGAYLSYRGHDYHFDGIINKNAIEKVREAIKQRRLSDIKLYREQKTAKEQFKKLLPKTFVTIEDSLEAGNCIIGTMNFYNSLPIVQKGFHLRALRADALLQIRDDIYTKRAVNVAIKKVL